MDSFIRERWLVPDHITIFELLELHMTGDYREDKRRLEAEVRKMNDGKLTNEAGCFMLVGMFSVTMICFTAYMIAKLFVPNN